MLPASLARACLRQIGEGQIGKGQALEEVLVAAKEIC